MTRIGVIVLILGLSIPLNAQMFEQVYPEFEIAEVHDGLQWNADTFFVCGFGQMLLRTTDAGRTWTNEMAGRRDWSFYRMERTTKYVYMLAEPTVFWRDSLPKGHLTALLRYDPRSGSFDVASFPKMPAADSEWTQIHDIAVAGSTFFLLQGNRETGLVLHRSTDEGSTWNRVPLPDSVELGRRASITCFDDSRFAVVSDVHGRGNHVHFTHDGGEHWFFDSTLIVSGSDTEFGKFTLMWLTAADVIASRPDGTIACSSDGGVHWTERSFAPCDVAGILAVSPDRGYVIGKHEEVFRSDDGFRSFVPLRPSDTGTHTLVAGGEDTLIAFAQNTDRIFLSHDGGMSWENIRDAHYWFKQIRMASDSVGVALVRDMKTDLYGYYRTGDGWKNMDRIMDQNDAVFPEYYSSSCMYPMTESLFYMVKPRRPENGMLIHRSMNGGETWERVLSVDDVPDIPTEDGITVVHSADTSTFGVVFVNSNLVVTTDQGESWSVHHLPGSDVVSPVMLLHPRGSSWIIRRCGGCPDTLWRSRNGWDNWEALLVEPDSVAEGSSGGFRSLNVSPGGVVQVFAEFDSPLGYHFDWGYIFESSNDGQSWEYHPMCMYRGGMRIRYLDDGSSCMVQTIQTEGEGLSNGMGFYRSTDGWRSMTLEDAFYYGIFLMDCIPSRYSVYLYRYNVIYRNSTGGVNGIADPLLPPVEISIQTPYPHPVRAGTMTVLPITVVEEGLVLRLTIHDMPGRQLHVIHEGRMETHCAHIPWNVDNLPAGPYIIRVQYGNQIIVKPVVVE